MREWSLSVDDALSLRIAADARFTIPDYGDDQIWELNLGSGEPAAVSIDTTYGLRALSMRLFPGFAWRGSSRLDPADFSTPPVTRQFLPNYIRLEFSPFPDLKVGAEYWVPSSKILTGRFTLQNLGREASQVRLRLHAVFRPIEDGHVMTEATVGGATVLVGRSRDLSPVLFVSGGAEIDQVAHPALAVSHQLLPGESEAVVWSQAGYHDLEASFGAARETAGHSWDAEIARLEMSNSSLVELETGDASWDAALALSQKVSLGCFMGPTERLPYPSVIFARLPDRGYSERGDGTDYNLAWDGQSAAQVYVNLLQILPAAPDLAKGVLQNYLAIQAPDGAIDWKPGLGGQRSGALCQPLLATLAWEVYGHTEDRAFLEALFPGLVAFFDSWFTKEHDRDQDGFPEWDHTLQCGFDDCPSFVRWQTWGEGLDITKAETPDLISYLYRECQSLIEMARMLGREDALPDLEQRADKLLEAVERSWSEEASMYQFIDRDQHNSPPGEVLGKGRGEFALEIERKFDPPVRILIRSKGAEGASHAAKVFIHGRGRRGRGRVERLTESRFQWFWGYGTATSDKTYAEVERIEVRGLNDEFETEVRLPDYTRQDQLGLLPLWAGIPDQARAAQIIQDTVLDPNRFWRPFGIASNSAQDESYAPDNRGGVGGIWMFWNILLGQALVDYGYVDDAAELIHRLMDATIHSLRTDKAFREAYNADEAEGMGERDHVWGVAPLSLFLYTLGVRLISPRKVQLRGRNPYPWPILLRWHGLCIRWEKEFATVTFPDGGEIRVEGEERRTVEQVRE